jgi:hypothetical protein
MAVRRWLGYLAGIIPAGLAGWWLGRMVGGWSVSLVLTGLCSLMAP